MRPGPWLIALWCLIPATLLFADPASVPNSGSDVLERYLAASKSANAQLRGFTMEVDIDAQLPRLRKHGRLQALRHISKLGRITYDALRWAGDNMIKTDVIARYLKAETQAQEGPTDLSITPANYKFKYKGVALRDGMEVYIFQVTPHKKKVGLFRGEVWVDPATYLPVRESGRFVKNPSLFLKKMEFVRDYEIRDGIAFPKRIESIIDTRLVGKAQLNISYTNFTRIETDTVVAASDSQ